MVYDCMKPKSLTCQNITLKLPESIIVTVVLSVTNEEENVTFQREIVSKLRSLILKLGFSLLFLL